MIAVVGKASLPLIPAGITLCIVEIAQLRDAAQTFMFMASGIMSMMIAFKIHKSINRRNKK